MLELFVVVAEGGLTQGAQKSGTSWLFCLWQASTRLEIRVRADQGLKLKQQNTDDRNSKVHKVLWMCPFRG